ncbi:MAG: NAD-dependent epimerase/dehydratase family protein [Ilumatobacteraceae bacterium]
MSTTPTPGSPNRPADTVADEAPEREREAPPATPAPEGGVLVIGGAGFIGSHLVERLIAEGQSVDVVDDLSTGSLGNLADARAEAGRLASSELRIHTLDATGDDLAALIAMRRPREIYHLALLARSSASAVALGRSFTSMLGVLDAARRSGVTKVVATLPATSMYGYPSGRELPVREGTLQPRGVRGVVAKAIVDLLSAYREGWGIEFTALAPATVYGPRQRPDAAVLPAMIAAAGDGRSPRVTGDGRQTRDFLYVDDRVDALVRSGRRGSGLVVNVGTGVQTSLRDLWTLVAPEAPPPTFVAPRPDELARFAVSPVRARIHLAWSPWTTLDEGIAALR